jgi:hypothetical protein
MPHLMAPIARHGKIQLTATSVPHIAQSVRFTGFPRLILIRIPLREFTRQFNKEIPRGTHGTQKSDFHYNIFFRKAQLKNNTAPMCSRIREELKKCVPNVLARLQAREDAFAGFLDERLR